MPLRETRSRYNRQGDFAEGFQQAFRRGLSRPTCGIADKQSNQLFLLLAQSLTHHPFQQSQHAASARVSKRTNPTRWSSRCTDNEANDNGRPVRQATLRSIIYASLDASTACSNVRCCSTWLWQRPASRVGSWPAFWHPPHSRSRG